MISNTFMIDKTILEKTLESVPPSLIDQIEELLDERPELGYIDVDEFVIDAVRRLMEQFGKTLKGRSDHGSRLDKR